MKILLLMFLIIWVGGCGTVLTPKSKVVSVNSDIPVEVWMNGDELVGRGRINSVRVSNRRGQDEFLLLRSMDHPQEEYRIDLERRFNRMTLLNLPVLFGTLGYPVDYLTGATSKLKKTSYQVPDFTKEDI